MWIAGCIHRLDETLCIIQPWDDLHNVPNIAWPGFQSLPGLDCGSGDDITVLEGWGGGFDDRNG